MKTIQRMVQAALIVLAMWVAFNWGSSRNPEVQPDAVVSQEAYLAAVEQLMVEREGLIARLEGRSTPQPVRTVYVDRPVPIAPISAPAFRIQEHKLTVAVQEIEGDSARARLFEGFDLNRCEESFSFGPKGFVCDPYRFGRFGITGQGYVSMDGLDLAIGPEWRRYLGSPYAFNVLAGTDGTIRIGGRVFWTP